MNGFASLTLRGSWPGEIALPLELSSASLIRDPLALVEFSTVGQALAGHGQFDAIAKGMRSDGFDIDAYDWWFSADVAPCIDAQHLVSNGLSVGAEVFIDGVLVHRSVSSWLPVSILIPALTKRIDICFRSMAQLCSDSKELDRSHRARWKTRLVAEQRLRLFRTPLVGRMPGWNLRTPIVGSHGQLRVIGVLPPTVEQLSARLRPDGSGEVVICVVVHTDEPVSVRVGEQVQPMLAVEPSADGLRRFEATITAPEAPLWWPHTHGTPSTLPMSITVGSMEHRLPDVAFREVSLQHGVVGGPGASISVNGVKIFARGVNWIPVDMHDPFVVDERVAGALDALVDAGMNMIRVAGTTVYADPQFYELCTRRGIMVWQDLMFANLDVPLAIPGMAEAITAEVHMVASRIASHGSVVVLCGGSEVEQQAAMSGASPEVVASTLGRSVLQDLCRQAMAHVDYVTSSPTSAPGEGGAPHHHTSGFSHYFGVGAYGRGIDDARRSGVGFTTECLAYAHIPSKDAVDRQMGDEGAAVHHPRWKQGVPRDRGAGWDFDDVRDAAVSEMFGVDPTALRWTDPHRYLDVSRAALAEVYDATFSEWRRVGSTCSGALVWTGRDLFPGAGWGITEHDGAPKSAWYGMARRCAPVMVALTDEGLNGVACHLVNDTAIEVSGELTVGLFNGSTIVSQVSLPVVVPSRSAQARWVGELIGKYIDINGAYQFGAPSCDLIRTRFTTTPGNRAVGIVSDAHLWPAGRPINSNRNDSVSVEMVENDSEGIVVRVASTTGCFGIHFDADGWRSSDDWFHLAPTDDRLITLRRASKTATSRIVVRSLSAPSSVALRLETK